MDNLYNWYAVNNPRGLAPEGWQVPSEAEWDTLITFLGGGEIAGSKMKETETTHSVAPNADATNSSGLQHSRVAIVSTMVGSSRLAASTSGGVLTFHGRAPFTTTTAASPRPSTPYGLAYLFAV